MMLPMTMAMMNKMTNKMTVMMNMTMGHCFLAVVQGLGFGVRGLVFRAVSCMYLHRHQTRGFTSLKPLG